MPPKPDATASARPTPPVSTARKARVTLNPPEDVASARGAGTPGNTAAGVKGKPSTATPAEPALREIDDPDEIDVSDQLDAWEDVDGSDLDVSHDLIIEEDEDEETSTSVTVWGSGSPSSGSPSSGSPSSSSPSSSPLPAVVTSPEEPRSDATSSALPAPPAAAADVSDGAEELEQQASEPGAGHLDSVAPETTNPDPEILRMPSETNTPKRTLVEAGTEFRGTLKSSCPVVVNGTVDGEIDAPTLSVASTGAIVGSVKAKTLHSLGTLSGNVDADEVFVSGAVRSKTVIRAKRLEVKIGSVGQGHLEVTFGNTTP